MARAAAPAIVFLGAHAARPAIPTPRPQGADPSTSDPPIHRFLVRAPVWDAGRLLNRTVDATSEGQFVYLSPPAFLLTHWRSMATGCPVMLAPHCAASAAARCGCEGPGTSILSTTRCLQTSAWSCRVMPSIAAASGACHPCSV